MNQPNATYTFEFTILEKGNVRTHRRQVPKRDLLARYDDAMKWVSESPKHMAHVYGPQVGRSTVDKDTRNYIITHVLHDATDLEANKPTIIGLFYADLNDSLAPAEMVLWKVVRTVEHWEGFEKPHMSYTLKRVAKDNEQKAFAWARVKGWKDWGTWYRGRPALVFSPDSHQVDAALSDMFDIAKHLEAGRLIRAPVRYSRRQDQRPYRYIQTTRTRRDIQRMRSDYPTAGEDMKYVPQEILIRKYGYPMRLGKPKEATHVETTD